ncbi:MAG: hypothetical protein J6Q67_01655 [Clostridia bacterium]|nr:hypothetical protein [Clostridia bacterium]
MSKKSDPKNAAKKYDSELKNFKKTVLNRLLSFTGIFPMVLAVGVAVGIALDELTLWLSITVAICVVLIIISKNKKE